MVQATIDATCAGDCMSAVMYGGEIYGAVGSGGRRRICNLVWPGAVRIMQAEPPAELRSWSRSESGSEMWLKRVALEHELQVGLTLLLTTCDACQSCRACAVCWL